MGFNARKYDIYILRPTKLNIMQLDISYERTPSGILVLSCVHEGQYYKRKYKGFTKKEATKHFKSLFEYEKAPSFQQI